MRTCQAWLAGLIAASSLSAAAHAQETIYTLPYFQLDGTAASDSIIRETRKGAQLVSAEIDFCFQRDPSSKWDRIVLPLKIESGKLRGEGTSQSTKTPVAIDLLRRHANALTSYLGEIKLANENIKVEHLDTPDRTREDLTDVQDSILLVENPADFTAVQPQAISVRVKRGALKDVFAALRGEPLVVETNYGLVEDCSVLRKEFQTIQFVTPPDHAPALVAKLRKTPGVIAAGWSGYASLNYAARIPAAAWTKDGKLDREKLSAEIIKSVANSLAATLVSSRWEQNTGQFVIELKRPSVRYQVTGFAEAVTARLMISQERLGSAEYFLVSVLNVTANLLDDGAGPRLEIPPFHEVGGEGYVDPEPSAIAIAKDLGGVTWDSSAEKWSAAK